SLSGRPMVVLLHPSVAVRHLDVFHRFIREASQAGARWTCFRDWIEETSLIRPTFRAIFVDSKATGNEAETVVKAAQEAGITDLIVEAYSPTHGPMFGKGQLHDEYFNGIIDEAHQRNVRVHAWFPVCFDPPRVKKHPEWGMVDANGERSQDWVCPTNADW